MTDDANDRDRPAAAKPAGDSPAAGSGGLRQRLTKRDARGRPLAVYAILGAGVLALTLLMVIVYFSDSDRAQPDQPICTSIDAVRAVGDIRAGEVERLIVAFDDNAAIATDPMWGPVLARVDYADGQCANLPQGLVNQNGIMEVIGAITFYNETTDSAQVEVVYNRIANLDPSLFQAATEAQVETPDETGAPASPTTAPTETPVPTEVPTEVPGTPAGTPIATPPAGTPVATGASDPASTPRATP